MLLNKKSNLFLVIALVTVINTSLLTIKQNLVLGQINSSSSSGSIQQIKVSQNFTGLWKGTIYPTKKQSEQISTGNKSEAKVSKVITLRFCVIDGNLAGVVEQSGIINAGEITSSIVKSENEVTINAEDKKGSKVTIALKLASERELLGTLTDGNTFKARKLNKQCAMYNSMQTSSYYDGNNGSNTNKTKTPGFSGSLLARGELGTRCVVDGSCVAGLHCVSNRVCVVSTNPATGRKSCPFCIGNSAGTCSPTPNRCSLNSGRCSLVNNQLCCNGLTCVTDPIRGTSQCKYSCP